MKKLTILLLIAVFLTTVVALRLTAGAPNVQAAAGGPVVLMGIDAEDGNGSSGSSHGGKTPYTTVVTDMLSNVSNGGSGILVLGGTVGSQVTGFWNAVGAAATPAQAVTHVGGTGNIPGQSFAGFAIIAVPSSRGQTFGGVTNAQNAELTGRAVDIAGFVNGGGGLIGLEQSTLNTPYGYLGQVGGFTFNIPAQYQAITPTAAGLAVGITATNLDVCCWHDEYITFPAFLQVLATNDNTGSPAAIGGARVIIAQVTCTKGFWKNHTGEWENLDPDASPPWGGGKTYLEILNTAPKKGDASVILAHAFITANLNSGADTDDLADAEALLSAHPIGSGDLQAKGKKTDPDRAVALGLAETLQEFNESQECTLPLEENNAI